MTTKTQPKPIADNQLTAYARNDWERIAGKSWGPVVRQLIAELQGERRISARTADQAIQARSQFASLDRVKLDAARRQGGRVLVVDCPAEPGERCEGETLVLADEWLDIRTARCPVGTSHHRFDEVLAAVLSPLPARFQRMAGELGLATWIIARYPRNRRQEIDALVEAKITENVLTILNELRDGMEAVDETQSTTEQVTEPGPDGAAAPSRTPELPW